MELQIGFSPCPNDTFIFGALATNLINTGSTSFSPYIADVEDLNKKAIEEASLHVTKLSFHAYAYCSEHYQLLHIGSALGRGNGPLLIAKEGFSNKHIPSSHIGIPGEYTTAHFLLKALVGKYDKVTPYLFSDIEDAILRNEVDCGVIIHENRFTYKEKGLVKLIDMGELWEQRYKLPLPLGCIAVRRDLPSNIKHNIEQYLKESMQIAQQDTTSIQPFIEQHAQTMSYEVMKKHIALYVNEFTTSIGEEGLESITTFFKIGEALAITPPLPASLPLFV